MVAIVAIADAVMRAAEDFPADLPVFLQSAALILRSGFAAGFALLDLLLLILWVLAERG